MTETRAHTLAKAAIACASITAVAARIGYSRPALSRYLSGTYPGTEKIESAILAAYDRRVCPHTEREIDRETCERKGLSPKPFGGREREAHWMTCQTCPHKPIKEVLP